MRRLAASIAVGFCLAALPGQTPAQIAVAAQAQEGDVLQQAQALRTNGQLDAAMALLRQALARAPNRSDLREELGYVLLLARQYGAADYHFGILSRQSGNPTDRRLYRAVQRRIAAERPFGFGLILGVTPSSNLTSGTSNSLISTTLGDLVIDDTSRTVAGWRGAVGVSGFARSFVTPVDEFRFDVAVSRIAYSRALEDETARTLGLSYIRYLSLGQTRLSLGFVERDQASEQQQTVAVDWSGFRKLSGAGQLDYVIGYGENRFVLNTDKNGPEWVGEIGYSHQVRPDLSLRIGLRHEVSRPEASELQFDGWALALGGDAAFPSGLTLSTRLLLGQRGFVGVFPLQTTARADEFADLTVAAVHSDWAVRGFAPQLTCRLRLNRSNVALFDFNQRECGISFTRNF